MLAVCITAEYEDFDRSNVWMSGSGSQNGDARGSHSPYEINTWDSPNDRKTNAVHCVHMRGLPFKASQLDVFEVFAIKS